MYCIYPFTPIFRYRIHSFHCLKEFLLYPNTHSPPPSAVFMYSLIFDLFFYHWIVLLLAVQRQQHNEAILLDIYWLLWSNRWLQVSPYLWIAFSKFGNLNSSINSCIWHLTDQNLIFFHWPVFVLCYETQTGHFYFTVLYKQVHLPAMTFIITLFKKLKKFDLTSLSINASLSPYLPAFPCLAFSFLF